MEPKIFKINDYITLKLIGNKTKIFVKETEFQQCKYLAFGIPLNEINNLHKITSIDDMEQRDRSSQFNSLDISPEEEFWGHCSNLQAWVENDYDTRLLHRNLAFPLLKRLTEIGDKLAKKVYKEEIILRMEEGNANVFRFLLEGKYLSVFSNEEIDTLIHSLESSKNKLVFWGIKNKAPKAFFDQIDILNEDVELAKYGILNYAPELFYIHFDKLLENTELAKCGVLHGASELFYKGFKLLNTNSELAMFGVENSAPEFFYIHFEKLKKDMELAKWGVENKALWEFYACFNKLKEDPELAKWGVLNHAPENFYLQFNELKQFYGERKIKNSS